MNKIVKILLVITGGILILCLGLGAVSTLALRGASWALTQAVDSNPASVAAAGNNIVGYTLPTGFGEGYAVEIADFSLVTHTAADGRTHIYLLQAPASQQIDRQQLEKQMSLTTGTEGWVEVRVIESQPCQIRGEETTLVISEGISHDGRPYRSASAVFEGNQGVALVNISGPTANWDQAMVETFIESLH